MIRIKKYLQSISLTRKAFSGVALMSLGSAVVYFLDKLSKYLVTAIISEGESIPIIQGILHITLVYNPGGAFGIFRGHVRLFTFSALLFTVIAVIYVAIRWSSIPPWEKAALTLLIGGALGNLSDRIRLGYVVDFIDLRVWPVFNVADSCITVGTVILIVSIFKARRNTFKGDICTG